MPRERRFRRSASVLSRRVGDEVLLSVAGRDDFLSISGSGSLVWDLLASPHTLGSLLQGVLERLGSVPEEAPADVERVVRSLVEAGAVEEVPPDD